MTPPDFDELARLWKQEHSAEEERMLQLLARNAGRQGKALQYAELGMGALLIAAIFVAFFVDSAPATLIVGGLVVAAVVWAGWKRHHRQAALLIDHSDRLALLESAVRNGRAGLRRSALGIALLVPGFLLGALFKFSVQSGGAVEDFLPVFIASISRVGPGMAGAGLLLLALLYLLRMHGARRREVDRLESLLAEYREEALLDRREQA